MPDLLSLVEFFGEPRVKDIVLAERLSMAQPERIRQFIQQHRAELLEYGPLRARQERSDTGRVVTAYYLSERQALALCQLLPAGRAPEVRRMLVETFVAWREGVLPAAPDAGELGVVEAITANLYRRIDDRVDARLSEVLANDNVLLLPENFLTLADFLDERGIRPISGPAKAQLSKLMRKFSDRHGYVVHVGVGSPFRRVIAFSREALDLWWSESGRGIAERKVQEQAIRKLPLFRPFV